MQRRGRASPLEHVCCALLARACATDMVSPYKGCRTWGVLQPMGGILEIPLPACALPYDWRKRGRLYAVWRLGCTGGTPRGGKSGPPEASAPWAVVPLKQLRPRIAGPWMSQSDSLGSRFGPSRPKGLSPRKGPCTGYPPLHALKQMRNFVCF